MPKTIVCVFLLLACNQVVAADGNNSACPPRGYSKQALITLQAKNYAISDDEERNALALALVPCLASTDPAMRDGIAFEALSTFMRGKQLRAATAIALLEQLLPWLDSTYPDVDGIKRPFAALVLSEVARMDRVAAFMSTQQRSELLNVGVQYLAGIRDYRGFDETIGWRHGVAHAADLMLQLAVNTQVDEAGLERILNAIAVQVVPQASKAPHFYIYGESERLARPVFYLAQRHLLSVEKWRAWLQQVASPAPFKQWDDVFKTQAGLAKRHNTTAFLNMLYLFVQESGDAQTKAQLLPLLVDVLKQIP